jgi:hypothetical protein
MFAVGDVLQILWCLGLPNGYRLGNADIQQSREKHLTSPFFGSPRQQVPDGGTTAVLLGAPLSVLCMARGFLLG